MAQAIGRLQAESRSSEDTALVRLPLPAMPGVHLYLKDESAHPSGSLKHRLARSLFLYGLCNGWIGPSTVVVDASSGSTAISEAWFARVLGVRYTAVVSDCVAPRKLREIERLGASVHAVPPADIYAAAERLAREAGRHYMDQFTYAERATDWRGNNNIAESIFRQMAGEPHPEPAWIVTGAGTGGTSATLGRYVRLAGANTRVCVADPEHSVFFDYYASARVPEVAPCASRIEGIGRPRVEPSFLPHAIDRMLQVPDEASIAAIHWLESVTDRRVGGSTGTALIAALALAAEMHEGGQPGSIVSLVGDGGERYAETYYAPEWLRDQGLDIEPWIEDLERLARSGVFDGRSELGSVEGFLARAVPTEPAPT